ncbi:MAG: hypothetical protein RLZZ210_223 [Pseudomonadota bacterium]|jgi:hypothetical protein
MKIPSSTTPTQPTQGQVTQGTQNPNEKKPDPAVTRPNPNDI